MTGFRFAELWRQCAVGHDPVAWHQAGGELGWWCGAPGIKISAIATRAPMIYSARGRLEG